MFSKHKIPQKFFVQLLGFITKPRLFLILDSQFSILNSQFSTYFPGLALKLYVIPIACWNDRSSVSMIFWLLGFTFTSRS